MGIARICFPFDTDDHEVTAHPMATMTICESPNAWPTELASAYCKKGGANKCMKSYHYYELMALPYCAVSTCPSINRQQGMRFRQMPCQCVQAKLLTVKIFPKYQSIVVRPIL